jgi:rod shape-determining protein MreC
VYLRGVRAENRELKQQIEQMRIDQVRLAQDAEQARRLQVLLSFKEKFIAKTVPAQVIGSSGSEQSRSVYIDKGSADGVKTEQAVITSDGIVGKVYEVFQDHTAKVLLVNDQSSGVGVVLEKSRLQGILRGTPSGELVVEKILSDESVQPGERVLTSGGDQIFPKGLDVGVVREAVPGKDSFLNIKLKPAANLNKLEEVLVVTQVENRAPTLAESGGRLRAADILAERLPSVPSKPAVDPAKPTAVPGRPGTPLTGAPPENKNATANQSSGVVATGSKPSITRTASGPNLSIDSPAANKTASGPTPAGTPGLTNTPGTTNKPTKPVSARSSAPASTTGGTGKPVGTEVVPTSTGNSKPSLLTKPAKETSQPAAQPADKSVAPAQTPAAPPEDPQ